MKKPGLILTSIGFFLAIIALGLTAGEAQAGIAGTQHDFSGAPWNVTGELCIVCHTPHNAMTGIADAPLWNHAVTGEIFTPYSSATLQGVPGQPTGASKLCLSCHDGVTNLDAFGGAAGSNPMVPGPANLGINLTDDHPISFTYDSALAAADGELVDPATITLPLFAQQVQCSTCHDVHNNMGLPKFLLMSNAGSALCLDCHIK